MPSMMADRHPFQHGLSDSRVVQPDNSIRLVGHQNTLFRRTCVPSAALVQDLIIDSGSLHPSIGQVLTARTHENREAQGVRCEMPDDHSLTRSQSERNDLDVCPALSVSVLFCSLPDFHGDERQSPYANGQNPMFRIEGRDFEDALKRRPGHNAGLQQHGQPDRRE